jgi:hypothetical protein
MARRNQPAVGRSSQIIGRRKALDSIYAPKKSPGPATGAFDLNALAALASMRRDHMTRAAAKNASHRAISWNGLRARAS